MNRIEGKVAVDMRAVCASHMGEAIKQRFLDEGAKVAASGRSAPALAAFAMQTGATALPAYDSDRATIGDVEIDQMWGGKFTPAMIATFARQSPMWWITTAEDVAQAAPFMAGDECFTTGQAVHLIDGMTLRHNPPAKAITAAATGQNWRS